MRNLSSDRSLRETDSCRAVQPRLQRWLVSALCCTRILTASTFLRSQAASGKNRDGQQDPGRSWPAKTPFVYLSIHSFIHQPFIPQTPIGIRVQMPVKLQTQQGRRETDEMSPDVPINTISASLTSSTEERPEQPLSASGKAPVGVQAQPLSRVEGAQLNPAGLRSHQGEKMQADPLCYTLCTWLSEGGCLAWDSSVLGGRVHAHGPHTLDRGGQCQELKGHSTLYF
nr:uncharacterized protein LOC105856756 isoform X2 [Microcebus murinus]